MNILGVFELFSMLNLSKSRKDPKFKATGNAKNEAFMEQKTAAPKAVIRQTNMLTGWSDLHHAVIAGDLELVRSLIRHGYDVNHQDSVGKTALHYAAKDGRMEVIRALLRAGAKECVQDNEYGYTPRCYAKHAKYEGAYNAAVFQAKKMRDKEGYYGWLANQIPLEMDHKPTEHVMFEDSDLSHVPKTDWNHDGDVV